MKTPRIFPLSLLALAMTAAMAEAQAPASEVDEIVVTGYRASLQSSTIAKRESTGFSDTVFADDIGKMPSQNLAESLARIPGVIINREVTGEGQQISVRGLGPNFTRVVLNGNAISVASSGSLDAGNRNREVDLDLFPTELFGSLSVAKTPMAHQMEGGVSGFVNMRTLRPSDMGEGFHFRGGVELAYNDTAESSNPKGNFTFSFSNDTFGALVSIVSKENETRVDGYEQDANFQQGCVGEWVTTAEGGRDRACLPGMDSSAFWYTNIASRDYAAAHPGVAIGDTLDINAVSGLTDEQLDNMGIGRIMRMMTTSGTKKNLSALVSLEFTPNEDLRFALDYIHAETDKNSERAEASLFYRNNDLRNDLAMIPVDVQVVDRGAGERLVSGTFYGARPWIGSRYYEEDLEFTSIMPSMSWQINDRFKMDVSYSKTESDFSRDEPYLLYYARDKGTINFAYNNGSLVPRMDFSNDLALASTGWSATAGPLDGAEGISNSADFRFARNFRQTETEGFHADFAWGEEADRNGIKFGISSDEISSDSQSYNQNSGDYLAYLISQKADIVTNFDNYIIDARNMDLGTDIDGYQGIRGIAGVDWSRFKADTNFANYVPPLNQGNDQFGQGLGNINEKMLAVYVEGNKEFELAGRSLRTNLGVRYVETDQNIVASGGETEASYSKTLPSMSLAYELADDVTLRFAASKSLTRANPSSMYPNTSWNSNSIATANAGNPFLKPFESTNIDFGGEYYFSELGFIGWNYYMKDLTGFTTQATVEVPFSDLGTWGLNTDNLTEVQQNELADCSPGCITRVQTQINTGAVDLSGFELIWVQPLDFLLEGLGFNASANKINQISDEGTFITGVSDSRSFTAYYENQSFQTRLTIYRQDGADIGNIWGTTPYMSNTRTQVDLSASYILPMMSEYNLTLTFDGYNLTNEPISRWLEDQSQTFRAYFPGTTYTVGLHASF